MKSILLISLTIALTCVLGCTSPQKITSLRSVGPGPSAQAKPQNHGTLQVHSARQQAQLDVHLEVYFSGASFLNEKKCLPAHTDYTVYTQNGQVLEHVRNARHYQDDHPAEVTLAPGRYVIEADTQGFDAVIYPISIPVVIEAGKTTTVHLEGDWRPTGRYSMTEVVKLPNGQIAGWQAKVGTP